jgi:hypothetical protein
MDKEVIFYQPLGLIFCRQDKLSLAKENDPKQQPDNNS